MASNRFLETILDPPPVATLWTLVQQVESHMPLAAGCRPATGITLLAERRGSSEVGRGRMRQSRWLTDANSLQALVAPQSWCNSEKFHRRGPCQDDLARGSWDALVSIPLPLPLLDWPLQKDSTLDAEDIEPMALHPMHCPCIELGYTSSSSWYIQHCISNMVKENEKRKKTGYMFHCGEG